MRRTSAVVTPVAHLVGPGKLKVVNGQLAFTAEGQGPLRLDPGSLRTLLCYGEVGVTDAALQVLFAHDVQAAWLTPAGTACRGRLVRADPRAAALRLLQYQYLTDPGRRLGLARWVVAGKIESQQQAARHYQRHGCPAAGPALARLQEAQGACAAATTLDQLRGVEGSASQTWFAVLGALLQPPWQFAQRVRRPPTDPVNALLSLGYTWLLTRTVARCEAAGLEVYLGALHEYRPGRPSLGCDLIEPLRVPAVDRWAVGLLNQGRLAPEDFREAEGGIRLQPSAFGRTLRWWEEHWLEGVEAALAALLEEVVTLFRRSAPLAPGCAEAAAGSGL